MVAATQQQQQQLQQPGKATAPSAEEEALKRNTDCVYFLASPLTCKKGSECEYRHSEYARVNPRDCFFWLNGNCLNPKCGFRHPPLDGLFGTQTAASAGSSLPPPQMAAAPSPHTSQNPGKQAVPCIFFQKGLCLKGDRCAFLHGPNPTSNKISQPIAPKPCVELPQSAKPHASHQRFSQEQKISHVNFSKAAEASVEIRPASKLEIVAQRNGAGAVRNIPPSLKVNDEVPKYKATNLHPVVNGNSSRFNRLHQPQVPDNHGFLNGKDADEFLRESSPGFDVLVDDELRNSEFYHGEDQYRRARGQEGMNLNPVDEYDIGHSADYSPVVDMDREYRDTKGGYDNYERIQGQLAWEQHGASSERMLLGPAQLERRGYSKAVSPEVTDDIDLRYHLSKRRRVNGLRSVVNHDFARDNNVEERGYQGSSRRDSHNLTSHESSISGRLRGRIKLPGRPSNGNDLHLEREERVRNRGRLSPGGSHVSSYQGRLRDRMKARVEEDYNSEARNLGGTRMRREMADDKTTDFAGPKSLAELKGTRNTEGRNVEGKMQQSLGKRKQLEDQQPSEGDLSFEGPMPLSEILKRKKEAEAAASGSGISSINKCDSNQKEAKASSNNTTVVNTKSGNESDKKVLEDEEGSKSATAAENTEAAVDQDSSDLPNTGELETKDGMIVDGIEAHEYEADDQREGDYEYEQVDEGEYYEEGENADVEEEDIDDEDGDDFAKKIGVMFS